MNVDVNGTVIAFPDNLSSDDLNNAVKKAASQVGSKPDDSGIKVPDSIRSIAQKAYAPFRATRALGVGAERLLENVPIPFLPGQTPTVGDVRTIASNAPNALARAKAAFQPGYQPQEGERAGAFLGETGGLAAATAPLGGIGAASLPLRVGIGAATAGGLTALQQASEQGKVKVLPTVPKSGIDMIPDSVIGNSIFGGALAAAPEAIQAFRQGVKNVAAEILPRTLAKTASIPERATQMAIDNPALTKSAPNIEQQIHDQTANIIDAVKQSKQKVGAALGKAYAKYAGMGNPIDEFISPEMASQTPNSLDNIRNDFDRAIKGGLLKQTDQYTGEVSDLAPKQQLQTLSQLKRDIQSQINYNRDPQTLRPIDNVKDAALKQMASKIDDLRSELPNGKKLSAVDKGWQTINDIYGQLQRDLSTPGKAEDMLMKLFKRDMSAITAGRTAEKIAALRRVESITGEKVLDPLFQSFTQREFAKPVGKGLSHTLLTGGGAAGMVSAASSGHPLAALGIGAAMTAGSPAAMGTAIRGAQALGRGAQMAAESPMGRSALIAALLAQRKKAD